MPPRPRTPVAPSRRPRVAGLRDPRRQDADTPTDDTASTATPTAPAAPAAPAPATTREDVPTDTATAPAGSARPTGSTTTAPDETRAEAPPAEDDAATTTDTAVTTDTAATTEAPAATPTETVPDDTAADGTTTAKPTRASRPRPTGRADRTRRPAPSSGRAPRADERRERDRDRPRGRVRRALAVVGSRLRRFARTRIAFPVTLVVVVLVGATLATVAFLAGQKAYDEGPIANSAVVNAASTAEVVGASRQVVEQALSYDYTKLDDSATAARSLGTGPFLVQYPPVFDSAVRPAATQQQLRQTATVLNIGVRSIQGDRADVIVFAQFTLQRAGGQSATSAGLLDLTMEREDGRWKLFDFKPLTAAP